MEKKKVIIVGALGMDFHLFNRKFRNNEDYEVVAFTYALEQNVGTTSEEKRVYPHELAGDMYPDGIPMYPETMLEELIKKYDADLVYLAYSDLSAKHVVFLGQRAQAAGAEYVLPNPDDTMIKAEIPVTSVCAVRTGCGKSQVSTKLVDILTEKGYKVISIREPMPYGDLRKQISMRFATPEDLVKHNCTVEEREEYEQYIEKGHVIYSGVDYEQILKDVMKEKPDIIHFDGGNNEIPFYRPDLLITVVDPLRVGHETEYYPGQINLRRADVVLINKENTAKKENIEKLQKTVKEMNPEAEIIHSNSVVEVENPDVVKGKRVLVVDDGPTITHGGMPFGAGYVAAQKYGCTVVDPRPFLKGEMKKVFEEFRHIQNVLPAMGYDPKQLKDFEDTVNSVECDAVLYGTPIDLQHVIRIDKPAQRARYRIEEISEKGPTLEDILDKFIKENGL
ncbi:MAG: GTPase [Methanomicrobia archaeon]|nr:GTPase [Methanomicrobia archaeon]